jgi:expansin (peptidoglycan-binding protein)
MEDQIEQWGSGPATNSGNFGPSNGNPQIWSGPPGALNCNGPNNHELVRNYYPPASALAGAQHMEWGFNFDGSPAKSTFWQQAIVAQYQCNPVPPCGVTCNFTNGQLFTGPPPGWTLGVAPPGQGSWNQTAAGVSFVGTAYTNCVQVNNQLLNTQVSSGPGTMTVQYCQTSLHGLPNMEGVMWDVDPSTGKGYGLSWDADSCPNTDSALYFNVYGAAGTLAQNILSTQTVNLPANSALCGCPVWLQLIVTAGNSFIVSIGAAQGTYSYGVTFTDSTYTGGLMGLSDYGCPDTVFKSFEWDGACGASSPTPTPPYSYTPTPTSTYTLTPGTPTATSTFTFTPTIEGTPTATNTLTLTPGTPTQTPTSTVTPAPPIVFNSVKYCSSDPPTVFTTIATTYTLSGAGNCGFPMGSSDPNDFAAINSTDYQNGLACGACAALQDASSGGAVTVMVVDNCPTCNTAHQLDLGSGAWNTLTNNAMPGVANITWNFVACPLSLMTGNASGNIEYEWKSSCSNDYNPIQFLDPLFPITSVSFSTTGGGTYTPLILGANGVGGTEYWGASNGNLNGTTGPFYFDLTDARGDSVTIGPLITGACGVIASTGAQFPGCGVINTPTSTYTLTPGTPTATSTFTFTPTIEGTPTPAYTASFTPTGGTATATGTWTPTLTPGTPTDTPTLTFTWTPGTPTYTPTSTPTPTLTSSVFTYTSTPTSSYTLTPGTPTTTFTPTFTYTSGTFTWTPTITPGTPTATHTRTMTPTITPGTPTATHTPSPTLTSSAFTYTSTPTFTYTSGTFTWTPTITPGTPTATATLTATRTATFTFTPTYTIEGTPTQTYTPSNTPTITPGTPTVTYTPTLTPTPTWTPTITPGTPTSTYTATQTWTPTATNTPTLPGPTSTPTPTKTPNTGGKVCSPPYPNPCDGRRPMCIDVQAKGSCNVTCDVFTLSYKKVCTLTKKVTGNSTLSWDLTDKAGANCSNGLYYLRVTVSGGGSTSCQTVKALILR